MRSILLFFSFLLLINISKCQTNNFDDRLVKQGSSISILEASLMIDEFLEIYKKDSLLVKSVFNIEKFNRTEYTLYCYNKSVDFFYKKLVEKRNGYNKVIVDKILSTIEYKKDPIKPDIDWSNVFKTCITCPFGEYPDERFFYFRFSVMFMNDEEIDAMIKYQNGDQWRYALMAIKGGDAFTLNEEENYKQYVMDRRIANYIIARWKDSNVREIQDLINVYKSVM